MDRAYRWDLTGPLHHQNGGHVPLAPMLRSVQTLSVQIILRRALQNQVKYSVGRGSENFFVFHRFFYFSAIVNPPLHTTSFSLFYSILFCSVVSIFSFNSTQHIPCTVSRIGGIVVAACILVVSTVHIASQPISCILEICKTFLWTYVHLNMID